MRKQKHFIWLSESRRNEESLVKICLQHNSTTQICAKHFMDYSFLNLVEYKVTLQRSELRLVYCKYIRESSLCLSRDSFGLEQIHKIMIFKIASYIIYFGDVPWLGGIHYLSLDALGTFSFWF